MRYLENRWNKKDLGLNEVSVLGQVKASDDAAATIDATIDAFLKGKAEIIGPFDGDGKLKIFGNNIAGTLKAPVRISYRDKDDPRTIKYRFEEKPATRSHIDTATLCTADENGSYETPAGEEVAPWVHVVCEDGSQADLKAIVVKSKKAAATKTDPPAGDSK